MRRVLLLTLFLVSLPAAAQSVLRYHYGDGPANLAWSSSAFDDRDWPEAPVGRFPLPPYASDGVVWFRIHSSVPVGDAPPLALNLLNNASAEQLFANGQLIGQFGQLPPHAQAVVYSKTVFPLPASVSSSRGSENQDIVIAVRAWFSPDTCYQGGSGRLVARVGPMREISTQDNNRRDAATLRQVAIAGVHVILLLIGIGLVFLWRWSRRSDLGLFALFLISNAALILFNAAQDANLLPISLIAFTWIETIVVDAGMAVVVEFARNVYDLRSRAFRYAGHAFWIIPNTCDLVRSYTARPGILVPLTVETSRWTSIGWDMVIILGCLWAIFRIGKNRSIAIAMLIVAVVLMLGGLDLLSSGLFNVLQTFTIANVCFTATFVLVRQALQGWRNKDRLAVEFAAAREVQQRLVPVELPSVPGLAIQAAYIPAAEVGGDFYQVIPLPSRGALIVVGDVSGKGLKAAMKGTLAIGAIRALAAEFTSPAELLTRLNLMLLHGSDGGFITCLCAHLAPHRVLTFANAGHIPPYRNGQEIESDSGLPLGLFDSGYSENSLTLAPGDRLTLLTDGVLEATNPATGELFGFERTAAISRQSANEIAKAAEQFGQEDDITVLTLTLASAEAAHV